MANKRDFLGLGKSCENIFRILNRGLNKKKLDQISQTVLAAVGELDA